MSHWSHWSSKVLEKCNMYLWTNIRIVSHQMCRFFCSFVWIFFFFQFLSFTLSSLLCDLIHHPPVRSPSKYYYVPRPLQEIHFQRSASVGSELVIAWCEEDIQWITSIASSFGHVMIYSKCQGKLPPSLLKIRNLHVDVIPNVGVCDNTYLHHIITRWTYLANWTVFYKGFEEKRCPAVHLVPINLNHLNVIDCDHLFCCPFARNQTIRVLNQFLPSFSLPMHISAHNKAKGQYIAYGNGTMGDWAAKTFGVKNSQNLFRFWFWFFLLFCFSFSFSFCCINKIHHQDLVRTFVLVGILLFPIMSSIAILWKFMSQWSHNKFIF